MPERIAADGTLHVITLNGSFSTYFESVFEAFGAMFATDRTTIYRVGDDDRSDVVVDA